MRSVTDISSCSYLQSGFSCLKLCLQWLVMPLDAGWLHLLQHRNWQADLRRTIALPQWKTKVFSTALLCYKRGKSSMEPK